MTVTRTNKGRYQVYESDETTSDVIVKEISAELDNDNIGGHKVVLFDISNKIAVAEVGR